MMGPISRPWLLSVLWLSAVAVIVAFSVAADANLSTSALLLVVCAVPLGVMLRVGRGAPPLTVAQILYAENTNKDGR